jgi:hypothetical protein
MKRFSYTYCLVKYVHDPAAGEVLNIGVLLFSPEIRLIVGKFERTYERLSTTFANFDGNHYRSVVTNMEYSISRLNAQFEPTLFSDERFENIKEVFTKLVPDLGLSIQFGTVLAGITSDLEDEAERVFQRLISSQYVQKERRSRSDEEIWTIFNKPLAKKQLTNYLRPKHFTSSDAYDLKFDHAFKNERWHILNPVSMDHAQADYLQIKAIRILGETTALQGNGDMGKFYLLLGEPRTPSHQNAYIKAKNLLNKIPIEKEIIEEREADDFAKELASYMETHGVFEESNEE